MVHLSYSVKVPMILRNLLRFRGAGISIYRLQQRYASILSTLDSSSVLVSANTDIYTNLALEHWLYSNLRFTNSSLGEDVDKVRVFQKPIVLIWRDEPCVVIGRHQNPWVESTLGFINKFNLKLARRHSGGGCVYHDESNINISIIGCKKAFENRKENLKFLVKVLDENYGIKCHTTERHDIVHTGTGFKISGSAAKLGRFNSYHHFTLLVDTNKEVLHTAIRQNEREFIQTNSTASKRSDVINLKELKPDLEVDKVISDLANAYNGLYKSSNIEDQSRKDCIEGDKAEYESLTKYRDELQSWEWIYGMTPKFKLERSFGLIHGGKEKQVKLTAVINKGLFESIDIDADFVGENLIEIFKHLLGTKFTYKEAMVNISNLLKVDEDSLLRGNSSFGAQQVFATFLLKMVHESNY